MFVKNLALLFFSITIIAITTITTYAANISVVNGHTYAQNGDLLVLELDGVISKGDTKKLESLIAQFNYDTAPSKGTRGWIELNSPGGNMLEGIALANLIHDMALGTRVLEGRQCASACALAFMAGTTINSAGQPSPMRQLHPRGTLAFHAPDLPDSVWNQLHAKDLVAAKNVEKVIYQAARGIVGLMRKHKWPSSLVEATMTQSADSFEIVDTVDETGRWHIELIHDGRIRFPGLQAHDFDPEWSVGAAAYCVNTMFWAIDEPAVSSTQFHVPHDTGRLDPRDEWLGDYMSQVKKWDIDSLRTAPSSDPDYRRMLLAYAKKGFGHPTNMAGVECPIVTNPDGSILTAGWGNAGFSADRIKAWQALPPSTKIYEVDNALARTGIFEVYYPSSIEPQVVSRKVRVWDHNGSGMQSYEDQLTNGKTRFQIVYANPKSSFSKDLIRGGTVLFNGHIENGLIRGQAFRFRLACKGKKPAYEVTGRISDDERHLTLSGPAPDIISGTCKSKGLRNDISAAELYFSAKWQSYSNSVEKREFTIVRALPAR